jgi:hypothetical protein
MESDGSAGFAATERALSGDKTVFPRCFWDTIRMMMNREPKKLARERIFQRGD